MINTIGWLGGILLAICGLPQAIKSYRTKSSNDLSWLFLISWVLGEILILIYVCYKVEFPDLWPLIINYTANIFFVLVIMRYKELPKKIKSCPYN